MLLSNETRKRLRITVHSFVAGVRELLQDPKLKGRYLFSERFSQDPLENFFGRVRQAGGRSTNPNVKMMEEATDVLRLQASSVRSSSTLKRRLQFQDKAPDISDTVPLAKRKQGRAKPSSSSS